MIKRHLDFDAKSNLVGVGFLSIADGVDLDDILGIDKTELASQAIRRTQGETWLRLSYFVITNVVERVSNMFISLCIVFVFPVV